MSAMLLQHRIADVAAIVDVAHIPQSQPDFADNRAVLLAYHVKHICRNMAGVLVRIRGGGKAQRQLAVARHRQI
ncbi:hypothetical protein SDC9_197302 [bioreactor metagenome]|uniref:Uncharacterized protein n=1 Tax=bioreactor metagenome TaxID=1076179 RepID=A0A645IEY9_9ZZZZ